jgi:hypothetical protein
MLSQLDYSLNWTKIEHVETRLSGSIFQIGSIGAPPSRGKTNVGPRAGNEVLEQGVHQEFSTVQFLHKINNRSLTYIREINDC